LTVFCPERISVISHSFCTYVPEADCIYNPDLTDLGVIQVMFLQLELQAPQDADTIT